MSLTTPRRSLRTPHIHVHTPKTSERKKTLDFSRDSMLKHRLAVVESESDSEGCDLGIISALDTSSSDEAAELHYTDTEYGPVTRSHTRRLLRENGDLKEFIRSPYTLKNFQIRIERSTPKLCSTPHTPHQLHLSPMTPSSSGSQNSISSRTRARKSLASLIADTESCSSSLKDLNFDTESENDSKENTPTKKGGKIKRTPNFLSFKGVLQSNENKLSSPNSPLFKRENISPTQMLKTPQTLEVIMSPPKIGHGRKSNVIINESPEISSSHKRNRSESVFENGPISKHPKLEPGLPKAKISLFNSGKLKELLSAKSFYSKATDPQLTLTKKLSKISMFRGSIQPKRSSTHGYSHKRNTKRHGEINTGVRHKIRKPKHVKYKDNNIKLNTSKVLMSFPDENKKNANLSQSFSPKNTSLLVDRDKNDPFAREHQTIEYLLSQWEDDEPLEVSNNAESMVKEAESLICFNKSTLEETILYNPNTAVPVENNSETCDHEPVLLNMESNESNIPNKDVNHTVFDKIPCENTPSLLPVSLVSCNAVIAEDNDDVMMNVDEEHQPQNIDKCDVIPVDGGYMMVNQRNETPEDIPDLDAIENELKMLDDQIKAMAEKNNIDANALLTSATVPLSDTLPSTTSIMEPAVQSDRVFPIFTKPDPGIKSNTKASPSFSKRQFIGKTGHDQYILDAGQKKFGATQCNECGVIYQIGDAQDENDHLMYHNATDILRYNGYKDDNVVSIYGTARCVKIQGTNEQRWKKVNSLLERVVHPQLGYAAPIQNSNRYTAYLYIEKRKIIGCLIVEPKTLAHRFIPGDVECCSVEQYRVKCGISRIWTHTSHRRQGVARRLLDCMRTSLLHGDIVTACDISFSSPTPAGREFATKYTGMENFYVYME